ncbi:uncharacterized protein ABID92_000782 [Frigoribacterium sp. PvP120]
MGEHGRASAAQSVNSPLVPHFTPTPYTLTVYDLLHRAGEMREHTVDVTVPEKLGEGPVAVATGAALELDVRLEGLHDGILASGHVSSTATGECSRCLRAIEQPVEVDFAELFAYAVDEAFDYQVQDDHVDLEPVVRDAVVLSLPFQPVCRPDCPGLDPVTGERIEDIPDYTPHENVDPRWSALAGFQAESAPADGEPASPGHHDRGEQGEQH